MTPLSPPTAFSLWNDFTVSLPSPVPFSFNPSLFNFYRRHFAWKPYYLLLYHKGKLSGLFPLVNTGKAWVSLPHFSYGGVLLNHNTELNREKLIKSLIVSIEKEKAGPGFYRVDLDVLPEPEKMKRPLYIRSLKPLNEKTGYTKVTSLINLPVDEEVLFQQLSANLRRKIRKAGKEKFDVKYGKQELLNDFYSVYTRNMYRLGSPAYCFSFFKELMATYDFGEALFFVVYKDKKPAGAAMLMSYSGFWENTWFSTTKEAQKAYVSDFLHEQMIKYAIQQKARVYSMGRSNKNGSVFQYKNHWPVKNIPLYELSFHQIIDVKNYRWLSHLWRKIPYPIACRLGSKLIKHIY